MRTRVAVVAAAACVVTIIATTVPVRTQPGGGAALAGAVTSQAEGKMEGVVVIAQREGSPVLVAVTSDAKGSNE